MIVEFNRVSFSYGVEPVLQDLSLQVDKGEFVLLIGRNGAGKSTMLRLLNGILRPSSGRVTIDGIDTLESSTANLARHVSVTFQHPSNQIFASTVLKEASFGPRALKRTEPERKAIEALRMFHLETHLHVHPYDCSPAQRKLLTLASAAATGAPVLAFDEPAVDLSSPQQTLLTTAIERLRGNGTSFLVVSHDLELFLPHCSKVLLLHDGSAAMFDKPDRLFQHHAVLRRAGVRLPRVLRMRPHVGLSLIPQPSTELSKVNP